MTGILSRLVFSKRLVRNDSVHFFLQHIFLKFDAVIYVEILPFLVPGLPSCVTEPPAAGMGLISSAIPSYSLRSPRLRVLTVAKQENKPAPSKSFGGTVQDLQVTGTSPCKNI